MSQSGVPIVQQAAGILGGKNVWGEVKSAFYQSSTLPLGTVDRWTKGAIGRAGIPLLSDTAAASNELYQDPSNAGKQGRYFQKQARNAAVVASAVYGGPALASATGLSSGASAIVAGKVSYDITQGNFAGALNNIAAAAGPISTEFGVVNPQDLVKKFTGAVGTLPRSPVENYSQPSQTVVLPTSNKISPIFLIAGIGALTFVFLKMRKK